MNDLELKSSTNLAHWGATIVAAFVAIMVLFIVAGISGALIAAIQYYMDSVRAEAAIFIGVLIGGAIGTYAARMACDAIFKSYSGKTIFIILILIALGAAFLEWQKGFDWQSLSRIGQWVVIISAGWPLFWQSRPLDSI